MKKIIWLEKIPYEPFKKKVTGETIIEDGVTLKHRYNDDGDEYRIDFYDAKGNFIKSHSLDRHDDYQIVEVKNETI